jgi:hypothetical protein
MAESHLLDALRCRTDLTFASQILPPRKGILRLRRGHVAMIIGASGFSVVGPLSAWSGNPVEHVARG